AGQDPDALVPLAPDRIVVQQGLVLVDPPGQEIEQAPDLARALLREIHHHAADPDVGVVHPQAGDGLEDLHDDLALPEAIEHHGDRAKLEPAGGDPHTA